MWPTVPHPPSPLHQWPDGWQRVQKIAHIIWLNVPRRDICPEVSEGCNLAGVIGAKESSKSGQGLSSQDQSVGRRSQLYKLWERVLVPFLFPIYTKYTIDFFFKNK